MFVVASVIGFRGLVAFTKALPSLFRMRRHVLQAPGSIRLAHKALGLLARAVMTTWESREHWLAFCDSPSWASIKGGLGDLGNLGPAVWEATEIPLWREVTERVRVEREQARYAPPPNS